MAATIFCASITAGLLDVGVPVLRGPAPGRLDHDFNVSLNFFDEGAAREKSIVISLNERNECI